MIDLHLGKVERHGILFERPSNARADDVDHGRKRHNLVRRIEGIRVGILPKQRVTNIVIGLHEELPINTPGGSAVDLTRLPESESPSHGRRDKQSPCPEPKSAVSQMISKESAKTPGILAAFKTVKTMRNVFRRRSLLRPGDAGKRGL